METTDYFNSIQNALIIVTGMLGISFVVLKLTGYIAWPWWLVNSPFLSILIFILLIPALIGWLER